MAGPAFDGHHCRRRDLLGNCGVRLGAHSRFPPRTRWSRRRMRFAALASRHKAIQHLLQPRMLELDLELVAFLRDDLPVAELAVEHALAEGEVGAALVTE